MISAKKLFFQRLKNEWLFNYKVFKTSLDWTIALYILIPLTFIGLYHYISLWKSLYNLKYFSVYIIIYLILYIYTLRGEIRSFVEYGDQLFLWQRNAWLIKISKMGVLYSLVTSLLSTAVVFLVIAPLLIVYLKLSYIEFIVLFFLIYIFRLNQMYIKQLISVYFEGWKRIFVYLAAIIISLSLYSYLIYNLNQMVELILIVTIIMIFLFYQLYRKKLAIKWSFYDDCEREHTQRIRYAKYFLKAASYFNGQVSKKKKKRSRPWLFRNSTNIYKKRKPINGLIELNLKFILRNKGNLLAVLQLTGFFMYGISVTENLIKVGVWIFFIIAIIQYIRTVLYACEQNQFLKLSPIEPSVKVKATQTSILYITLPSILLISFFTGYLLLSTIYFGLLFMFMGILFSYLLVKIIK